MATDGLQDLLAKLPPAGVLMLAGTSITAAGGWLFFVSSGLLLNVAGIPRLSAGLATFTFGVLKTGSARRLAKLERRELETVSSEGAEQVEALLADGEARSVATIGEALELSTDEVLRALGVLQKAGRIDEDVDLETGVFTYRLNPDVVPLDGDDLHSHRPLGERLREIE